MSTDEPVSLPEVPMADGAAETAVLLLSASSPRPTRVGTPARHDRTEAGSRAPSVHPEAAFTIPTEAPLNGAPVRQYINTKVTGPLLEGMKMIAKEQPRDPLRVLGEYLLQRSKELEGTK